MTQHQIIASQTSLLDRPIWNALSTDFAPLSECMGTARALPREMSPFAASAGFAPHQIQDFLLLLAHRKEPVMTIEVETPICPRRCIVEEPAAGIQMIAKQPLPPKNSLDVCDLSEAHATQIFDLAELCKPGPFRSQTHSLGDFIGVFRDETLVAMAGQRLKMPGFTEISAVCVDPEHRGCGIGAELVRCMSERILDAGNVPFLHVYASNTSAIALYEHLGFEARAGVQATNWIRNAAVQYD